MYSSEVDPYKQLNHNQTLDVVHFQSATFMKGLAVIFGISVELLERNVYKIWNKLKLGYCRLHHNQGTWNCYEVTWTKPY